MAISNVLHKRKEHPDSDPESEIFGPKRSISREAIEKRPPLLRIGLIASIALVASAISALALTRSGDGGDTVEAGVPEGTELTRSGNIRVTEAGRVIDALDVRGYIYVQADDVTIRRTSVRSGGPLAIRVGRGVTGVVVEDSSLTCTTDRGHAGIAWGNYTATRVEVSAGCNRGFLHDGNTTITGSYWDGEPFPDVSPDRTTTTEAAEPEPPPSTEAPPATTTTTAAVTTTTAAPQPEPGPPPGPPGDFPDASTTGVPEGVALRRSGGLTVSEPGAVVEGLDVTGTILVEARDVTIRNTRITTAGNQGVRIAGGATLTIEDSQIIGTTDQCDEAISFGNYTAVRIDVSGCQDGLKANGTTTVRNSYIHDLRQTDGSHNDGIQVMAGQGTTIEGNTICAQYKNTVSAIKMTPERGPIDDVTIRDNMLYGGGYVLYMDSKPNTYGLVTNARVENNVLDAGAARWGPYAVDPHPTQQFVNNTIADIMTVFSTNPCDR